MGETLAGRPGVSGPLKVWNPQNLDPDKNPAFLNRLVVLKQPPFVTGQRTHVAIMHEGLGGKGPGGAVPECQAARAHGGDPRTVHMGSGAQSNPVGVELHRSVRRSDGVPEGARG